MSRTSRFGRCERFARVSLARMIPSLASEATDGDTNQKGHVEAYLAIAFKQIIAVTISGEKDGNLAVGRDLPVQKARAEN